MNLLHLVTYNHKFVPAQLKFLSEEFGRDCQKFYLVGGGPKIENVLSENVVRIDKVNIIFFIIDAHRAKKIFLNGMFSHELMLLLLFFPYLLKKTIWMPWGGDLYWKRTVSNTLWNSLVDCVRGLFFRRIGGLASGIYGDYKNAQTLYQVRAPFIPGGANVFSFSRQDLDSLSVGDHSQHKSRRRTVIQVGNSADPSNEHLETFDWLSKFSEEDIEIHVPLNYGYEGFENYRSKVMSRGYELFNNKFKPILDFMDPKEYNEHISKLDILIFNHRRQQGFETVAIFLYLGGKAYIRKEVSTWEFLSVELGCKIYDPLDIKFDDFQTFIEISERERLYNKDAVGKLFDRDYQIERWKKIYTYNHAYTRTNNLLKHINNEHSS